MVLADRLEKTSLSPGDQISVTQDICLEIILDPKQEDCLVGQSDAIERRVTGVPRGETLSYQEEKCMSHHQYVETTLQNSQRSQKSWL